MIGILLAAITVSPTQLSGEHVKIEIAALDAVAPAVAPGGDLLVTVRFDIDPKWHLYWLNPGDSGEPPKIKWTLPPGWTAEPLRFPTPHRHATGPIVNHIHEGSMTVAARLHAPLDAGAEAAELAGRLSWLVCQEDCIPGFESFTVKLPAPSGLPVLAWQRPLVGPSAVESKLDAMGYRADPVAGTYTRTDKTARISVPALSGATQVDFFGEVPGFVESKPPPTLESSTLIVPLGPLAKSGAPLTGLLVVDNTRYWLTATASGSTPATNIIEKHSNGLAYWQTWSPAREAELRAQKTPVFVRFTADWCTPCKVAERQVFSKPAAAQAFANTGVIPLVADWTDTNLEVEKALKAHGKTSIPLYAFYRPGQAAEILAHAPATPQALDALLRRDP